MGTKPKKNISKPLILFIALVLCINIFASWKSRDLSSRGNLDKIMKKGVLEVITTNTNTTFYYGKDGVTGLEYDLIKEFSNWLGVDVDFTINNSISGIINDMFWGRADIAAAGLTRTPARENMFLFGPDYFSTHLVLIVHKDNMSINSVQKLTECKALIPKGASYQETLNALRKGYPGMGLEITENLSIEQVIEKVALKEYSCTIADENIFEINQRFFPDLRTTAVLSDEEYFAWMIGREGNELNEKIHEWFEIFQESGRYDQVIHKYYGHTKEFDYVDVRTFHNKILKVLPKYKKIFELAAEQTNLEWSLLAALAYQESHWKKYAKSPTGVRGIMMLTQKTASEVDVKNRLNPEESILGGAKYLKKLIDRVPDTVHPDDKILFALAAYNIGMGHIYDVRKVAGWFNKDPDSWMDIKSVLPLLSQKEYYKKLKYGYARGQEPVDYVDRIINYKEILDNFVGEYFAEPAKKK